ncbi:MAG: trypsin-like peptidase domain-containing protein [Bacteroidota bacterium]|nr:trypsin-like peptidase domain-containing protein [Bacteroidota bacterium]
MKFTFKVIFLSFFSGILGAYTYTSLQPYNENQVLQETYVQKPPAEYTNHRNLAQVEALNEPSFVDASKKSTSSVVYIKSTSETQYGRGNLFDWFFEGQTGQSMSSGSGVIFTKDGYIVTNNHVIEKTSRIEIIHNKRVYEAELIGTDPSTDLAVLKIDAKNLPNIQIGSSKDVAVGEWVLAVGNPFNLTSTVTAGIVSAKGREINILSSKFPIESFIQTDAAINPGNSGGALVNTKGELIGINTAIMSRTGTYNGYGFAVPVDIVKKIVMDLIKYGEVQKAFLGADVVDVDPENAKILELSDLSGVVVSYIQREGAAEKSGLQKGDIILAINDEEVNSRSGFEELISYYSPGEKIKVTFKHNKNTQSKTLELTNKEGTTGIIRKEIFSSKELGADFEIVPKVEKNILNIDNGVRVTRVKNGLIRRLGIQEDFIITAVNNQAIDSPKQLTELLTNLKGKVRIEGVNKEGVKGYYSYYF